MKILITEDVCKDICKNIELKKTHRTYRKTLMEYYESNSENGEKSFQDYVLSMIGYSY